MRYLLLLPFLKLVLTLRIKRTFNFKKVIIFFMLSSGIEKNFPHSTARFNKTKIELHGIHTGELLISAVRLMIISYSCMH